MGLLTSFVFDAKQSHLGYSIKSFKKHIQNIYTIVYNIWECNIRWSWC